MAFSPHSDRGAASLMTCALLTLLAIGCGSGSSAPSSGLPTSPSSGNLGSGSICQTFSAAGSYTLSRDVPCLFLEASNVDIDCNQHAVSGISTPTAGMNVSLRNCHISGMTLMGLSTWTIADSLVEGNLFFQNAHGVVLRHDTVQGAASASNTGYLVYFFAGTGNSVVDSSFDGSYTGQCNECGADDAVLIAEESGDTIQGNTIRNTWDAGIEGAGTVTNTTIAGNSITNAANAGIGSFWCTHWEGNQVTGNQIASSGTAMYFEYDIGPQCGGTQDTGLFTNKTIANNTFRNPVPVPSNGLGLILQFERYSPPASNNVLEGNDIGSLGIYAMPSQAFINGGGNVCGSAGTFTC